MKRLKHINRRKGFSLTECIIAMGIFAMMSVVVMQILAIAMARQAQNYRTDKNMDAQILEMVSSSNTMTDSGTMNLTMKFMKAGDSTKTEIADMDISDVKIKKSTEEQEFGYQLNTFDADIDGTGTPVNPDDGSGPGSMMGKDNHLYGAKGLTYINVAALTPDDIPGTNKVKVTWNIKVQDENGILKKSEANAFKVVLPDSSDNVTVNIDPATAPKLKYMRLSDTNYRFIYNQIDSPTFTLSFVFEIPKNKYESEFGSFEKYFIDKNSESTDLTGSATLYDLEQPGLYNKTST